MKKPIGRTCLIAALIFILPGMALSLEPSASLVSVIGLDDQGKPRRQGMGVLWGKEGKILTSASLLTQGPGGIVKTAAGDLHRITGVVQQDAFQDLAIIQIDKEIFRGQAVRASATGLKPPEKVWVGVRPGNQGALQEAQVTKIYPFSPRLILMKLEPADLAAEPGSPVFNHRGELIGMLHAFGGSPAFKFYLQRDRQLLPENNAQAEKLGWAGKPSESRDPVKYVAFWEGVAASLQQRWPEAQKAFSAAVSPSGQLPEAYYGRGVARYHLGDFSGAALDLEAATRQLPGYALAFLRLGEAQERLGRGAAARASYERASQASADLDEAWFHLGELAYRQGDFPRARKYLEQAGGVFPATAQRWYYLGAIARDERRWPEALEAFSQAIKHDPGLFQAYLDKGNLLVQDLGRPKEAVEVLTEAVRLEPRQPQARYSLGLANLMSGNPKGAWEQYFALERLSPHLAANLEKMLEKGP